MGLFPEGTKPTIEPTAPNEVSEFHRGFSHLVWKVLLDLLVVLAVAIASLSKTVYPTISIHWLQKFDRLEPFFKDRNCIRC